MKGIKLNHISCLELDEKLTALKTNENKNKKWKRFITKIWLLVFDLIHKSNIFKIKVIFLFFFFFCQLFSDKQ